MSNFDNRLEEILEGVANEYSAGGNYENAKPLIVEEAEQAIRTLILEEVLDRLESQSRRADECTDDTYVVKMIRVEAERNRLKERRNDQSS